MKTLMLMITIILLALLKVKKKKITVRNRKCRRFRVNPYLQKRNINGRFIRDVSFSFYFILLITLIPT